MRRCDLFGTLGVLLLLSLWAAAAHAEPTAPLIDRVAFRGPPGTDSTALRWQARTLLGARADRTTLVGAIRSLERLDGVGGIDIELEPSPLRADGAVLTFVYDGVLRRVGQLAFTLGDRVPDEEESWRFRRRLATSRYAPTLREGAPLHPYLLRVDSESVAQYYKSRGHQEAEVTVEMSEVGALSTVVFHALPGPRYFARTVTVAGASGPSVHRALRITEGDAFGPEALDDDAERLRRRQCSLGRPDASVSFTETLGERVTAEDGAVRQWVDVEWYIDRGVEAVVSNLQVAGRRVDLAVLEGLPLVDGAPFCPDRVEQTLDRLRDWYSDHGVLTPRLRAHIARQLWTDGIERVAVTIVSETGEDAKVARIFFDGNTVTREDILRQLLEIHEGEIYRKSAVDASVQAMRRSGLFRKVAARAVPGPDDGTAYLYFTLVEQRSLRFNVTEQQMVLRNISLLDWPEDFAEFESGGALRGAGQRLELTVTADKIGADWTHGFLSRNTTASVGAEYVADDDPAYSELSVRAWAGLGVQALGRRVSFLPRIEGRYLSNTVADPELPLLSGSAWVLSVRIESVLDVTLLDTERVRYLGIEGRTDGRISRSFVGEQTQWAEYTSNVRAYVPLYENARGQHLILQIGGTIAQIYSADDSALFPLVRVFPGARGFAAGSEGVSIDGGSGGAFTLGGLDAIDGSVQLRIPLPFGRRNAIAPFVDVLGAGDSFDAAVAALQPSFGGALEFSLFGERIEGTLWGAWPLEAADASYIGGSVGGGF